MVSHRCPCQVFIPTDILGGYIDIVIEGVIVVLVLAESSCRIHTSQVSRTTQGYFQRIHLQMSFVDVAWALGYAHIRTLISLDLTFYPSACLGPRVQILDALQPILDLTA